MANSFLDTTLVDKAIKFAVDAHSNSERRGKGFPYVIHVLEAMEIVATLTNDPELLAAAALHDTVEDTDVTIAQLRAEFGDRIAGLVEIETDRIYSNMDERATWRSRKLAGIERLSSAPYDAKVVAMGDKLSNMRAIRRDYAVKGDALWEIFHAPGGKADHEWRYRRLAEAFIDLAGTPAYKEFLDGINEVFGSPKPELIDMNDYVESGDGYTAISYNHKEGKKMMKLYAPFVPLKDIQNELETNWATLNLGIKNPAALRLVTDGTRFGVEFERITPKVSFARAISNNPEKLEEYATAFARMTKKLHSTNCDTSKFDSIVDFFRTEVTKSNLVNDKQKKNIIDFIDSVPQKTTCCHGDLHIGNAIINTDTGEEYWIDLGDFRWGNPLFDLGMTYFTVFNTPDDMIYKLYHISKEQMLKVWDVFLTEYYGNSASLEEKTKECARFAAILIIRLANRSAVFPEMVEFVNTQFPTEY